jgi:hypothetical protein
MFISGLQVNEVARCIAYIERGGAVFVGQRSGVVIAIEHQASLVLKVQEGAVENIPLD